MELPSFKSILRQGFYRFEYENCINWESRQPDAFLLRDVAIVLMDCGLRPEESFRLKWTENIRDGAIEIHTGKGRGSRRRIPISRRVQSVLEMRRAGGLSEWCFPRRRKAGTSNHHR